MALLTDQELITTRDLLKHENDLLETADRERVEIETKISLAIDEISTETETELEKVFSSGAAGSGAGISVRNVVATPALLRWLKSRALSLFYFACYGNQLNERFKRKFEHYSKASETAKADYLQRGIGISDSPLAKPGALDSEVGSGTVPPGAYYFAATWVNSRGQESALGTAGSVLLSAAGGVLLQSPTAPQNATGWNVYLGRSGDELYRQNAAPLAIADAWNHPGAIAEEVPPGSGQLPDRYLQVQRIFQRG
jgi:hypothetical protein